ncbi:MAG: cysteine desulfurase [Nitrososphaerota archaeon]|nr:cysteine desulfurase [Candidatus Bathyarchaeota archaeon]MDW8194543.1 cysteine desulfurase [Nitrososphaerota archaeon]
MLDPYRVREDFPILNRTVNNYPLIYFDNAATSQKPRQVIEAMTKFYQEHNANVHRAVHTLSQEATELYEKAHEEVAKFINARHAEEIIFVRGATEAINLIAYSWALRELGEDDEILLSLMEHHSNIVPWEVTSKIRGFKVKYVDVNSDGTLNYKALEKMISEKTKMVSISHVSNVTGVINDIERIAKIAHENGALLFVDGAQSVPHMPVDVRDMDIDFLAFSGHKMLGPTGIGVLYGKLELLREMEPFQGGGEMIRNVTYNDEQGRCSISWNDVPWRFEAGTPNICGGIGLMAAVNYLRNLGIENVFQHERNLTEYTLKRMSELSRIRIYGPMDCTKRCGIIPFNVDGLESHDVALFLDNYGIMIRSGFHCAQPLHQRLGLSSTARVSFYVYNTREEVDRFIEILKEMEQV